jgi:hypothetical protein
VHNDYARDGASRDSNVRVRPFSLPLSYLRQIGGRDSKAARYPRVLACHFPTSNVASATPISHAKERKYGDALPSIKQREIKQG